MMNELRTYKVRVTPLARNVAPLVVKVAAPSQGQAIERVREHMERRAVNHITKLAATGYLRISDCGYSIES